MTVLVTGGAGYIGSHTVLALLDQGYRPVVLDDLSTGVADAIPSGVTLRRGDVADASFVDEVLRDDRPAAIMHFAGSIVVPESVTDPGAYYANNTAASLNLARAAVRHGVGQFIFSSTAAVYGEPGSNPVKETDPTAPISPYGWSKLMTEQILKDLSLAHTDFRPIALRYFNVGGADPAGRAGQRGREATHLIRAALDVALGRRSHLQVFGADYPTRDGTCERDFIHVSDLAAAHVSALRYLAAGGTPTTLNCGYGRGATVREVVAGLEAIIGRKLPTEEASRRPGDAPSVVADTSRLFSLLDWKPEVHALCEILRTALAWEERQGAVGEAEPAA